MDQNLTIFLIRPGSPDQVDQPTESWITEFKTNLDFLCKRFLKAKTEIRIVTDKDPDQKKSGKDADGYLFLMRDTFLGNKSYISFLNTLYSEIHSGQDQHHGIGSNIFRIDLSEISGDEPAFIQQLPSYDFFRAAENNQGNVLLLPDMKEYWPRFLDLVTDLKIVLQKYDSGETGEEETTEAVVYLAATAPDQEQNRDIIRRELLVYGCRVYPDMELNFSLQELKSYIWKYIEKSRLSIHLLGDQYGSDYPVADIAVTELQLQYVTEYIDTLENDPSLSVQSPLLRMIWLPPEMKPADERQEKLIAQLRRDIEKMSRTEIIQAPLELFKTLIIRKLREPVPKITTDEEVQRDTKKLVYLIHDKRDEEAIQPVSKAIASRGFRTEKISYDNGSPNLINKHKELLMQCDAALIYYHSGSRTWLMSKLSDLLKAPGLGRVSPMLARGILIAGPDPADNISFPKDTLVMKGKDPLSQLDHFIEKLK
jgi:hypothetical protein